MDANQIKLFHSINKKVHPNCEMFLIKKKQMPEPGAAFHNYFYTSGFFAENMRAFLFKEDCDLKQKRILDFASGYGRMTRYLVHIFGEVVVSDIEQEMLDFNRIEFGTRGFLSFEDLEKVSFPDEKYDVVFCCSLFTHLHPLIWRSWFDRLSKLVADPGYFIFSTRSRKFAEQKGCVFEGDIHFNALNENPARLDLKRYGQTSIDQSYIENLADEIGHLQFLATFQGGEFDWYQDVHVFRRYEEHVPGTLKQGT